jgi:hypothetical protein
VSGCNVFGGGWLGSATKARTPTVVACAWEGEGAAAAPKACTAAVGGTPAWAPEAGRIGGDMVAAGP